MAVSRVGTNSASGTSVTIPTHQAGDLIILVAYRRGSSTPPTLPGTATNIISPNGSQSSFRVGYKIAAGSSETSGTWTNATSMAVHVYRGASGIGDAQGSGGVGTVVTYPALTMTNGSGSSWVMGVGLVRDTAASLNAPSGMTNVIAPFNDSTISRQATHDTNAGVSSWSVQTVATGVASTTVVGGTIEILSSATPATGTISQTLSALTQSATGNVKASGTSAQSLSALTQAATGSLKATGTSAQTLPSLATSLTGSLAAQGAISSTLPALEQSAAGTLQVDGTAANTLPSVAQDASGTASQSVTGTAAQILPTLGTSASGSLELEGTASQSLPSLGQSATARAAIAGSSTQGLPQLTQSGSGGLEVSGMAAQTLPAIEQQAVGHQPLSGSIAQILPALTQSLTARAGTARPRSSATNRASSTGQARPNTEATDRRSTTATERRFGMIQIRIRKPHGAPS